MIGDYSAWWQLGARGAVLLAIVCGVAAIWPQRYCLSRVGWIQLATLSLLLFPALAWLPVLRLPLLPETESQLLADAAVGPAATVPTVPSISQAAVRQTAAPQAAPTNASTGRPQPADSVPPSTGPSVDAVENALRPIAQSPASGVDVSNASTRRGLDQHHFRNRFRRPTMGETAVAIYLLGVAAFAFRLLLGLRQLGQWRLSTVPCVDDGWLATCDELRSELQLPRPVELRVLATSGSPLACGHRWPLVVVPAALIETATEAQRRAILCHELAHVARRDFAWQLLMRLAQTIWWFQPLVWLLGRQLTAAQEQVCDGVCVARLGVGPYGQTLVHVARLMQAPPRATLAVSMARPGRLARRLARLTRQPGLKSPLIARPRGTLIATVVLMLAVCCGLLYPVRGEQPHPSPANDKSAAQSKPALPIEQLVTLQDAETGKPLRNTTVRLQRQRFQTAARLLQSVGETFELRTDGEGKLRIEFDELSQLDAQQTAMIDLAIDGYAGLYVVAPALEDIDQLEPTKEYCHASTPFSTRVFEPDGQPANHACVFLEARVEGKGWFYFTSSDEQGHLRCQVPREQSIGLTISSAQGAPTRLVVSGGVATVPDIHLRRGAVVSGQLLDREGHPLPGRTIVMAAEDSQAVQGELEIAAHGDSIGLELHRRTDADGKFRFGPMLGDVQVYLERNDDAPQGELLLPAYLELSAGGDQWLPLMVAPTGELRGTLRTSEGTPVADQAVSVVLLPHRSNSYFTLCTVRTDVEGKYALRVPFPLSRAIVNIDEQWTADGMRRVARAANSTLEVAGRYLLEQYVGQPMTIDWIVTTEDGDAPRVKPANRPVAADMQPLANLEAEIKSAWSAYEQARDAAETDEQRSEIQETQDPFDRLVARCLEFEAQHRGTRVAIGALYYVMQAGASSLSPKINAAREQAVDTLREHYVDHPDVDLLLTQFTSGAGVANSEPLLLALADRSPFDYVRATAMLELAEARFTTVRWAEAFKASPPMPAEQEQALIDAQESPSTREMLKTNFENMRRFRAALEKVNADELRNSAVDLLDRVTSNYPDTEAPLRQWLNRQGEHDHPALHLVERTDKWRTPTPAQRAEILRFQHTRLRVGLIAPEIEGLDFEQRPVRLSQFRGKVVLVTFTRGNVENELYAQCQVLQQALAGRPFTCLSVIPGGANGGFSARSIAKDGGVTWPVLRDSHDDILSQRWCQVTFPEAYLIGPDGKIVYHHSPARDVDRLRPMIERLLGDADEKLADQKP